MPGAHPVWSGIIRLYFNRGDSVYTLLVDQNLHPSSAHISSASRSRTACAARGMSLMGRGGAAVVGVSSASNRMGFRTSGRLSSASSSSSLSTSNSIPNPALRAALMSIGFGREKIDCPDLYPTQLPLARKKLGKQYTDTYCLITAASLPN